MWGDFYLQSKLLANECRVLSSERFYWEFWGLGFRIEASTGFKHNTVFAKDWWSSPFITGWGTNVSDKKRGLPKATWLTRGKVHTRTSLLTLMYRRSKVIFGHLLDSGATGSSGESKKPSSIPTLTSSRYGTRQQTTSTWWGHSPTSSWASRRAVATSSTSVGSHFPPGKHTSPGDRLSWILKEQSCHVWFQFWDHILIQQVHTELVFCTIDYS